MTEDQGVLGDLCRRHFYPPFSLVVRDCPLSVAAGWEVTAG